MWLLEQDKAREMRHALLSGLAPKAQDREAHLRRETEAEAAASMPRNMSVAGDVAEIRVEGVLTRKPDLFAWLFGGGNTTYEQIQAALAVAGTDPAIRRVVLQVGSPGGTVDGLFETLAALEAFGKPVAVRASQADSAAYAISAVAGPIEATSPAAEFGSIGVAATFLNDEELIDITSTEAPNKRPDVTTEEGKAVVREYLDAIHDLFVDAIAQGRTKHGGNAVTAKTVNAEFGRGSVFVAKDAKARGMIDKAPARLRAVKTAAEHDGGDPALVAGYEKMVAEGFLARDRAAHDLKAPTQDSTADGGGATPAKELKIMDINELKAQHPELYAAVLEDGRKAGFEEGKATGVEAERKRVKAHLHLGSKCAAMDIALEAIDSGASTMDEEVHAKYLEAGINKRDRQARQEDSDATGKVVDGAQSVGQSRDLGDQIVALMEQDRDEEGRE